MADNDQRKIRGLVSDESQKMTNVVNIPVPPGDEVEAYVMCVQYKHSGVVVMGPMQHGKPLTKIWLEFLLFGLRATFMAQEETKEESLIKVPDMSFNPKDPRTH